MATVPSRRQHQGKDAVGIGGQRLKDGQSERGRLAAARQGAANGVPSFEARINLAEVFTRSAAAASSCIVFGTRTLEDGRDTHSLDGGRRAKANRIAGLLQPFGEAQGRKSFGDRCGRHRVGLQVAARTKRL